MNKSRASLSAADLLALNGAAISPYPSAFVNHASSRRDSAKAAGRMMSPKSPRPVRRSAQHSPRRRN